MAAALAVCVAAADMWCVVADDSERSAEERAAAMHEDRARDSRDGGASTWRRSPRRAGPSQGSRQCRQRGCS